MTVILSTGIKAYRLIIIKIIMALPYHPNPGTILRCSYDGLVEPEMIKDRPVIIVSPRARSGRLYTVVPISTTVPDPILEWHYNLIFTKPLAPKWPELSVWVKCDMLNTFRSARLERFHSIVGGKRKYYDRRISESDLKSIRFCISKFLAL